MSTPDVSPAGGSMLNIGVAGTALSTYYLADPALFLHEQRDHTGAADAPDSIRHARRELRRLTAGIDETSTLGQARSQVLNWLGCFGWRFPPAPPPSSEPIAGCDEDETARAWILVTRPASTWTPRPPAAGPGSSARSGRPRSALGRRPARRPADQRVRTADHPPRPRPRRRVQLPDRRPARPRRPRRRPRMARALGAAAPRGFPQDRPATALWDALEKASAEAAEAVSEDLSGGVRIAITAIANGALEDLRRRGQAQPEPRALFADALRIAYRLLFIAYAEDRGLLPAGIPAYDSGYSLRALRDLAATPPPPGSPTAATSGLRCAPCGRCSTTASTPGDCRSPGSMAACSTRPSARSSTTPA